MIACSLRYHAPETLEEATELLAEHGSHASVLGGGTMLVPSLGRGASSCTALIDPISLGIDAITAQDGDVTIGARTTYRTIVDSPVLAERVPLLVHVARGITGGAQVRNVATAGGSACYANPASDVPAVLAALDARMTIAGPEGRRTVPAAEFFAGAFRTDLRHGELLVSFTLPDSRQRYGYHKLKLCEGSWPIVTATAVSHQDGSVTITLGGAYERPVTIRLSDRHSIEDGVSMIELDPWSDELAPADYRQAVAPAIARKALAALA